MSVWIRAEPFSVVPEGGFRRVEVAIGLAQVLWLEQQADVHGRQARMIEPFAPLHEIRTRGPRKVVHIVLSVTMGHGSGAAFDALALLASGADDPSRGHRNTHVVAAEVGVELAVGEKLVCGPAAGLEDPELGEPLRHEEVFADRACSIEIAREPSGPLHSQSQPLPWFHRRGQVGGHQRPIVLVLIVG